MSQTLPELVQVAVAGRYVTSPWGLVPRPRALPRIPAGLDPDYVQSVGYERLVRHNNRKKPLWFPFQSHSLIEVEEHLRALSALEPTFECSYGLELLARQADAFVASWKHNPRNGSLKMQAATKALREIWDIAVSRLSDTCPKCDATVKKRLALRGFVT